MQSELAELVEANLRQNQVGENYKKKNLHLWLHLVKVASEKAGVQSTVAALTQTLFCESYKKYNVRHLLCLAAAES